MAITYNTSLVREGLLLHLDAANPKSWSPNTHPKPLDIYSWAALGGAHQITLSQETGFTSPAGGRPMKMVTAGTSGYTSTYNSAGYNIAPAASGQTWTFSFWVKGSTNFSASAMIFGANSAGSYLELGQPGYNVTTEWTRVSGSYTLTNGSTTHVQFRFDVYVNGVTMWVDGLQIERASTASGFSPITNTDGVLFYNLGSSGQTGVAEQFPTFQSTLPRRLTMDGVNDNVRVLHSIQGTQTIEVVYKLYNPSTGWGPLWRSDDWVERIFSSGITIIASSGTYYSLGGPPGNTDVVNICYSYNGTNAKSYINGTLSSNITMDSVMNSGTYTYRFGMQAGGSTTAYVNMDLYSVKMYNRQLSDAEVRQNFESTRDRYGI